MDPLRDSIIRDVTFEADHALLADDAWRLVYRPAPGFVIPTQSPAKARWWLRHQNAGYVVAFVHTAKEYIAVVDLLETDGVLLERVGEDLTETATCQGGCHELRSGASDLAAHGH